MIIVNLSASSQTLLWPICTLLAFLLPARTPHINVFRIFVVSITIGGICLFASGYIIPGGAGHFFEWAQALVSGSALPQDVAQRDVGFPLLLVLSGYTFTGSFIGITLIHAAFAVLMPVFIYATLRPFSAGIAYYAGQMANVSLGSFLFIKLIHHDQVYIFTTVLMLMFLSIFLTRGTYKYLYLFSLACVAASICRPAGNLLFPLFLIIAFAAAPRPRRLCHYLTCAAIFAAALALYQWHRYEIFDIRHQQSIPSYVGAQVFYNTYMNSQEYGIILGPEIGPNMSKIDAALRQALGPIPRDSKFMQDHVGTVSESFAVSQFLPFTTDQLMERVYLVPNWEYYALLCDAESNDQVLLRAALEIAAAHPIYVLRYSLRNLVVFLFHPGYAHTRYNLQPFSKIRLDFFPSLAGIGANEWLPPRALREAKLDLLATEPSLARKYLTKIIRELWLRSYQLFVKLSAILMVTSWLAVAGSAICAIGLWRRTAACGAVALWSQADFVAALFSASMLLAYNAMVTAVFAEPDYRYHHFMLLLRVLIAGFGAIALLRVVPREPDPRWASSIAWRDAVAIDTWCRRTGEMVTSHDLLEAYLGSRRILAAIVLSVVALIICAVWTASMLRFAG